MSDEFDFDFMPFYMGRKVLPKDVRLPNNGDVTEWPRFEKCDFCALDYKQTGDWVIVFAQLEGGAGFQVAKWNGKVATGKSPTEKAKARAIKAVWEAYMEHYKGMGKSMSRKLTAIIEETRALGLSD